MLNVKNSYKTLVDSETFKDWQSKNSDVYLTHAFCLYEKNNLNEWQFGYYHKNKDKITTFVVKSDGIDIHPESEILKRDDLLNPLVMDEVSVDLNSALKVADELQKEKYKGQLPMKIVVLLQQLKEGLVWNLTYLTMSFKTLNIKVSAKDSSVLEHDIKSLISDTLN